MDFKKLSLEDLDVIKPFLSLGKTDICDLTMGGIFLWRDYYKTEFCIEDDIFISRLYSENGEVYYNLPLCKDVEKGIKKIISKNQHKDNVIRFCTIPEGYLPLFREISEKVSFSEQVDNFDYVYRSEDLSFLKGRKYSAQRNHISQFKRLAPDWKFLDIKDVPVEEVKSFFRNFCKNNEAITPLEIAENKFIEEVFDNLDTYNMLGGVLTADKKVIGFSFGEIMGNTLFTHIEKADRNYKGAYQMLTNQFTFMFSRGTEFINREDDTGDEGLRKAKNAYHPVALLKKYVVEVKI